MKLLAVEQRPSTSTLASAGWPLLAGTTHARHPPPSLSHWAPRPPQPRPRWCPCSGNMTAE
eukprot:206939-Prorocentrum_lima.AAC.1